MHIHWQLKMEKVYQKAGMPVSPEARFDSKRKTVVVQFPAGLIITRCFATLSRTTVEEAGVTFPVEPSFHGQVEIPAAQLPPGQWHLELNWEASAKKFFYATDLYLHDA